VRAFCLSNSISIAFTILFNLATINTTDNRSVVSFINFYLKMDIRQKHVVAKLNKIVKNYRNRVV
jgi:hypothetical protein